jgi:hypothetical protein
VNLLRNPITFRIRFGYGFFSFKPLQLGFAFKNLTQVTATFSHLCFISMLLCQTKMDNAMPKPCTYANLPFPSLAQVASHVLCLQLRCEFDLR